MAKRALAGQGDVGFGRSGAQPLADDVVPAGLLQVAAVLGGGEAPVGDPHDAPERPVAHVVFDLADQRRVAVVTRPRPHPHRDAFAGDRHPDDDLRQVVTMVFALAMSTKAAVTYRIGRLDAGAHPAAFVTTSRWIILAGLEVGAGGVEEQQIDLQVQQISDLTVNLFGHRRLDGRQRIHRPIAGLINHFG